MLYFISSEAERNHRHSQIVFEALTALVIGILGASLNAPPLKDITWQSEMKQRCVFFVLAGFILC